MLGFLRNELLYARLRHRRRLRPLRSYRSLVPAHRRPPRLAHARRPRRPRPPPSRRRRGSRAGADPPAIWDPLAAADRALTTTEDGGLGFARMEGYRLCLWLSMEASGSAMEWTRGRVIDLGMLLPVIDLLGFAHVLGNILVGTFDGFFSSDPKSGRIDKVEDGPGFFLDVDMLFPA